MAFVLDEQDQCFSILPMMRLVYLSFEQAHASENVVCRQLELKGLVAAGLAMR